MRFTRYIPFLLFLCAACGTIAQSDFARPVAIRLQPDQSANEPNLFDPPFLVETSVNRTHESLCVITSQRSYWEAGDKTETAQPHPIEIQVGDQIFTRDELGI